MLNRSQSEITCSVVQITGSLVAQFDEWAFDDGMGGVSVVLSSNVETKACTIVMKKE